MQFWGKFNKIVFPVDGVYQLTFFGLLAGSDDGNIYIRRNDDVLCQSYLLEQHNTAMCTAVAELTDGDSVRVTGTNNNPADLRGV